MADAEAGYRRRRDLVDRGLDSVLPAAAAEPRALHRAMRHAVFAGGGGKRLRPVLLLTLAGDLGVAQERALPAAMALELVHSYSLVHDDLPCMDDAATRRGAPATHAAFGYATAVLAGDGLLTLAFELLGRAANSGLPRHGDLVVELAVAAGSLGMVGGQQADLDLGRPAAEPDVILRVHSLKAGKLFGFALAAPGYLAGFDAARIARLRRAGESFGLAFQIADDLRDAGEDLRAPNYARAAGPREAMDAALGRVEASLDLLIPVAGGSAETLSLIREAAREMGLRPRS